MYEANRDPYRVLVGKPERKSNLEDPGTDGKRILKCILNKRGRRGLE
jgi:hypothetical protein